jgi:hypothetical protein
MAGDTGIIVVAWWDGERKRLSVGYVGESGIEKDTFYCVDANGNLIKSEG